MIMERFQSPRHN